MDAESLYLQLRQLVAEMPDLSSAGGALTAEKMGWLGRTSVLVSAVSPSVSIDPVTFNTCANNLDGPLRDSNAIQIGVVVHRALARAEAMAPSALRGGFIPAGGAFDVFQIAGQILGAAKGGVLIVDPYMDAVVFTDFAPLVPERIDVRLLCDSASTKVEAVLPAWKRWVAQYGSTRPLEIRMTPPKRLHDRLVFVDGDVWSLTQSFKDFAKRSPASVQRLDPEIATWKRSTYTDEWDHAVPPG